MGVFQYEHGHVYREGEHAWHYTAPVGTLGAIRVVRFEGGRQYNVCTMDTLSNPYAERDADVICRALSAEPATPSR